MKYLRIFLQKQKKLKKGLMLTILLLTPPIAVQVTSPDLLGLFAYLWILAGLVVVCILAFTQATTGGSSPCWNANWPRCRPLVNTWQTPFNCSSTTGASHWSTSTWQDSWRGTCDRGAWRTFGTTHGCRQLVIGLSTVPTR